MKHSYEMDLCSGPILPRLLRYALPLMLSSSLQLFFNAADVIVVGRFAGSESLAAVGSTSSLTFLLINLFLGLSVGVNVLVARYYGAKDEKKLSDAVHTAILVSLLSGFALVIIGELAASSLLKLMGTPENVIDKAVLYLRIYFAGMPVVMLYNFGSAILRAVGDTRRPLYFLATAGVINVALNLVFVILLHLDVAGVALATVLSQVISDILLIRSLTHSEGAMKLSLRRLRINRAIFIQIVRIGVPAGLQGILFSLSNTLIQSAINSLGSTAIAGNTAAANLEGFVVMCMNAFHQSNLSFTSQNIGAGKYDRLPRILKYSVVTVIVIGGVMGWLVYFFGPQLLGIYSTEPEVIQAGMVRVTYLCTLYFIYGVTDVMVGSLRGFGYSLLPTAISLTGICAFRVFWIFVIFPLQRTMQMLYLSFPASWILTLIAYIVCYRIVWKRFRRSVVRGKK